MQKLPGQETKRLRERVWHTGGSNAPPIPSGRVASK